MNLIKNPNNPLNKSVTFADIFWVALIVVLVIGNIFFISKYLGLKTQLKEEQSKTEVQNLNGAILQFTQTFIEKVLDTDTEVDFETRLKLENAVRDLEDQEILAQWNKFVESETESDAQENVKNLLKELVTKIQN